MKTYSTFLRVVAITAVLAVAIMVIGSTYGEPPVWGI